MGYVVQLGERFLHAKCGGECRHPAVVDFADEDGQGTVLFHTLRVGDKVVSPFTTSCGECRWVTLTKTWKAADVRMN